MDGRNLFNITVYDVDAEELRSEKMRELVIENEIHKDLREDLERLFNIQDHYYQNVIADLMINLNHYRNNMQPGYSFFSRERMQKSIDNSITNTFMGMIGVFMMLGGAASNNGSIATAGFGIMAAAFLSQVNENAKDYGAVKSRVLAR